MTTQNTNQEVLDLLREAVAAAGHSTNCQWASTVAHFRGMQPRRSKGQTMAQAQAQFQSMHERMIAAAQESPCNCWVSRAKSLLAEVK